MIEKESYSQQDVDYAFSLGNKDKPFDKEESQDKALSVASPYGVTPSGIYKSLIFEKIFRGVFERLKNLKQYQDIVANQEDLTEWLDYDMKTCLEKKPEEMKTVIRAQMKNMPKEYEDIVSPHLVVNELMKTIRIDWISRLDTDGKELLEVEDGIKMAFHKMVFGRGNIPREFKDELTSLVEEVSDEEQKPDDR